MKHIPISTWRATPVVRLILYSLLLLCFLLLASTLVNASPLLEPTLPDGPLGPLCTPTPHDGNGDNEEPNIKCEKFTNGAAASAPTDDDVPVLAINAPITWEYRIINIGDLKLYGITVVDDQGVVVSCPETSLTEGRTMSCYGYGNAIDLQGGIYANRADVSGTDHEQRTVTATCSSHYINPPCSPAIDLEKSTNGFDADEAPGPEIPFGERVTWTYIFTNTGDTPLTNVTLADDRLGAIVTIPNLPVGATHTETRTGTADQEAYANLATVTGNSACGDVRDQDPSHYHTTCRPAIDIEKWTNGVDADVAPGPHIRAGEPVTWTYIVENTGTEALTAVTVTDDQLGTICTIGDLAAGAVERCTQIGVAALGQYANNATVNGVSQCGPVDAQDPSHYFGYRLGIDLEKSCNAVDADQPPGPTIPVGQVTTWRYLVHNTGTLPLTDLVITDDPFGGICTVPSLGVDQSTECVYSGTVTTAQIHANLGTAIAYAQGAGTILSRAEARVEDSDPSHCNFEVGQAISLSKTPSHRWIYTATNIGARDLTSITWSLPPEVEINPPPSLQYVLKPQEDWSTNGICDFYSQCGGEISCTAKTVDGLRTVFATLPAIGFPEGLELSVTLNGQTTTQPADLEIPAGQPIIWRYNMINKTAIALTNVELYHTRMDNSGFTDTIPCPKSILAVNEAMECTINGTAEAGPITSVGYVQAMGMGDDVVDSTTSHYFGLEAGTIQGRAFLDLYDLDPAEANGIQDPDEFGIAILDVELYAVGNATPIATENTGGDGTYTFSAMPGEYYLRFIQPGTDPSAWLPWSMPNQPIGGGQYNDHLDSDAIPDSAQVAHTAPFTLTSGGSQSGWDVGLLDSRVESVLYLPVVCHK